MSHSCENEHRDHDHTHESPIITNPQQSLYSYIDITKIQYLNVIGHGNFTKMYSCFLKPRDLCYNISEYIESDTDCQMLLHIPFTYTCKLLSIIFRYNGNGDNYSSPRSIKFYKNFKKNLDFDTISSSKASFQVEFPNNHGIVPVKGTNEVEIVDDNTFIEFHFTRLAFSNCHSITIFVENNWSNDEDDLTQLYYLEIRGEVIGQHRKDNTVPLTTVYESAPNPLDHIKLESEQGNVQLGM